MKRLTISLTVAAFAILTLVATVAAASPTPTQAGAQVRAGDTIPTVLGLSRAAVMDLRHDGLTLAQVAERQNVDPQKVIDALVAQWTERVDARVTNGALTTADADALKAQITLRATSMVGQATVGGMGGAAVGAGRGAAGGAGVGAGGGAANRGGFGNGSCDGTGPHGAVTP